MKYLRTYNHKRNPSLGRLELCGEPRIEMYNPNTNVTYINNKVKLTRDTSNQTTYIK